MDHTLIQQEDRGRWAASPPFFAGRGYFMKVDTYKCDVCGRIKGETNHWFRIDTGVSGLELNAWGVIPPTPTSVDLCSDQCVIKIVQKWLTKQAISSGARYPETRTAGVVSISGQRAI
jgi:hypothetical protein